MKRFDENTSPNFFQNQEKNRIFLQRQQNYANHLLRSRGHVFLNDVYDMLDIPRTREGAIAGWWYNNEHDGINFGIVERDNGFDLEFNVDGVIYDKLPVES